MPLTPEANLSRYEYLLPHARRSLHLLNKLFSLNVVHAVDTSNTVSIRYHPVSSNPAEWPKLNCGLLFWFLPTRPTVHVLSRQDRLPLVHHEFSALGSMRPPLVKLSRRQHSFELASVPQSEQRVLQFGPMQNGSVSIL